MNQFYRFPSEFFLKGIGRSELYLGWGLTQGIVSWVAWEGKVWLILKVGRWDFQGISILVVWDKVVGEWGWVFFLFLFLFFVIW